MKPSLLFAALCMFSGLVPSGTSHAQAYYADPAAMADRIQRLEQELRDLQFQVNKSRAPFPSDPQDGGQDAGPSAIGPAGGGGRLDDMEQSLRRLTGQVEQMAIELKQLREQSDLFRKETQFRLGALEGGAPAGLPVATNAPLAGPGASVPVAAPMALGPQTGPASLPPKGSPQPGVLGTLPQANAPSSQAASLQAPEEQYNAALSLLSNQQYDQAQTAFRGFTAAHPKHELAGPAQYFVADIDFVKKSYAESAKGFTEVLKGYPKSTRAPDAMLKLGLSLLQLGNKNDGCLTLGAIKTKYPSANAQILDRAGRARKQFTCT